MVRSILLLTAALILTVTHVKAQGLEGIIVEQFHTLTAADAEAYNSGHGGGSYPLSAGMVVYRVFVDMAPNYRLISVLATPNSPASIRTTTTFWNDDNFGSHVAPQTRRFDEGVLFDSYVTINTSGNSGGTAGCGSNLTQQGILRTLDSNGDLTTCGVYPDLGNTDGHLPAPTPPDALNFLGSFDFTALSGTGSEFAFSDNVWGILPAPTGVDPTGTNHALIGQFTTDGDLSFEINVALATPNGGTEEYVHMAPNEGQILSDLLIYPSLVTDCMGMPGGPALPGAACDDGDATTGADTWSVQCQCIGLLIDCLDVPGGPALPNTACDDGNLATINDVYDETCTCMGTPISTTIDPTGALGMLTIYPNPADQYLTIAGAQDQVERLQLYDAAGRTNHFPIERTGDVVLLDISALANGTYVLEVVLSDGMRKWHRVIIAH